MNEKSTHYRMFRLFGWRVYISREPLKSRHRSDTRKSAYRQRMDLTGCACESCGTHLSQYGHILHTLPKGHEGRNSVDELRVLCAECFKHIQSQISRRCYDAAAPEYSEIVSSVLAAEKGGEA